MRNFCTRLGFLLCKNTSLRTRIFSFVPNFSKVSQSLVISVQEVLKGLYSQEVSEGQIQIQKNKKGI